MKEQVTEEEVRQYAYLQIIHVSKYGCDGIKCKKCCMNRICDHYPSHSREVAKELIEYSKMVKEEGSE